MRIGVKVPYAATFADAVGQLPALERAGASAVYVSEAYSFDAVSKLGFLSATLPNLELVADILPIYSRTPALLAMTAAGLDYVSGGRFTLGLGSSGPQVIEGFHGVPYDSPIDRTRDVIEICRAVWRRERLEFDSVRYTIPLTIERGGSGLGKPLKLINPPVRERIPIMLASMGPRNVALTAELAEQWTPFFFCPEKVEAVWGAALREGLARRDEALGPLGIAVPVPVAIGDDVEHLLDHVRPQLALYIGGMGARGKNFYNDLARRYGYDAAAERIQRLYLEGRAAEAAAAVPTELIRSTSLIGPKEFVRDRVAAFRQAGVTTLVVEPTGESPERHIQTVQALAELVG